MSYLKRYRTNRVPQWEPLPGQVENSAGGHSWAVDEWTRLRRFLILGSEGGSYYAGGVEADARERQGGRAGGSRRRQARGGGDRRRHRARAARRRTTRRCSRSRWRRVPGTRRHAQGGARGAAAGGPHVDAPVPVRDVRRGLPRLGPLAASRSRRAGTPSRPVDVARVPGGQVPPARGHVAPRPPASGPPGAVGVGAATRRSRSRTSTAACSSGSSAAVTPRACRGSGRGLRARPGGGDAEAGGRARARVRPPA